MMIEFEERLKPTIINEESEALNKASFQSILEYFELDDGNQRLVMKGWEDNPYRKVFLGLTKENGFRRVFEIDGDVLSNEVYKTIYRIIRGSVRSQMGNGAFEMLTEESVQSGKVNGGQRLMRYINAELKKCAANGQIYINDEIIKYIDSNAYNDAEYIDKRREMIAEATFKAVDEIYSKRSKDKTLIMVSLNPIDKLFSSTGHGFTSCHSLTSSYSGAYYMGLPLLMANDAVLYVAIVTGKFFEFSIGKYKFKVPKVVCRTLVHIGNEYDRRGYRVGMKRVFHIARLYPYTSESVVAGIEGILSKTYDMKSTSDESMLNTDGVFIGRKLTQIYFTNREEVVPFFDNAMYGSIRSQVDGSNNITMEQRVISFFKKTRPDYWRLRTLTPYEFDYQGGFIQLVENGESIFDARGDESDHTCEHCGAAISDDDTCYYDDTPYCHECFGEHYFYCYSCGEAYRNGDRVEVEGVSYCDDCAHNIAEECANCGEMVRNQRVRAYFNERHGINESICPYCAAELNEAGRYHHCALLDAFVRDGTPSEKILKYAGRPGANHQDIAQCSGCVHLRECNYRVNAVVPVREVG